MALACCSLLRNNFCPAVNLLSGIDLHYCQRKQMMFLLTLVICITVGFRLSFCISVSVIHKALVTYPLSLVSLRIAAGLLRFFIHMYPICIYSPCMSPFFDQNYGSKSEPVFCWYGGIAQEMRVAGLTATTFCELQRKRLRWSLQAATYKYRRCDCRTVPTMAATLGEPWRLLPSGRQKSYLY